MKSYGVTIQKKSLQQYCHMALFAFFNTLFRNFAEFWL